MAITTIERGVIRAGILSRQRRISAQNEDLLLQGAISRRMENPERAAPSSPFMSQRVFTNLPPQKGEDYHGSCQIAHLPAAYTPGSLQTVPKSLNLHIAFEDALKLGIAIQSCLHALNRHNRSTKAGKSMGLSLSIKFDVQQIAVLETQIK